MRETWKTSELWKTKKTTGWTWLHLDRSWESGWTWQKKQTHRTTLQICQPRHKTLLVQVIFEMFLLIFSTKRRRKQLFRIKNLWLATTRFSFWYLKSVGTMKNAPCMKVCVLYLYLCLFVFECENMLCSAFCVWAMECVSNLSLARR